MLNTVAYRIALSSIFLAAVTFFIGALLACQEKAKIEEVPLPEGVVLQKLDKAELLSRSICTDQLKAFTILSNSKNPLKIMSDSGLYYSKSVYKIYLLPNMTFTGTLSSKNYENGSDSALEETSTKKITGAWLENKSQLILTGLGKIRKVKRLAANQREEDVKEIKFELVLNDSFENIEAIPEEQRTTVVSIENSSVGPKEQKIEEICKPL